MESLGKGLKKLIPPMEVGVLIAVGAFLGTADPVRASCIGLGVATGAMIYEIGKALILNFRAPAASDFDQDVSDRWISVVGPAIALELGPLFRRAYREGLYFQYMNGIRPTILHPAELEAAQIGGRMLYGARNFRLVAPTVVQH